MKKLFTHAKIMLQAAEAGFNGITHQTTEPSGHLSLTLPAMLATDSLFKDVAAPSYIKKYVPIVALTA